MNNLLSFWLAPITALFHPRVFQDAAKRSAWKAVLYVLYLALITGVLTAAIMMSRVLPAANAFVAWAEKTMPVVIWTPDGISLENGQTTALMSHPQYGPVIAFDMNKTSVTDADMNTVPLLVTATKIYIKRAPGQIEARDITKAGIQTDKQLPPKVRINGEVIRGLFGVLKSTLLLVLPPVITVLTFLFILTVDLFYSLAGLLFNLMRKQKLRYGSIFSLTCFATTASFTLAWIQIILPFRVMPLPLGVMVLVNLIYIFIAFKVTDINNDIPV